jgi:hypothetical protein
MPHRFLFARSVVSVVADAQAHQAGPRRQAAGRGAWRMMTVAETPGTAAHLWPAAYAKTSER